MRLIKILLGSVVLDSHFSLLDLRHDEVIKSVLEFEDLVLQHIHPRLLARDLLQVLLFRALSTSSGQVVHSFLQKV